MKKILIDCRLCKYYYVTWEPEHPHGCRAMQFKSPEMPNLAVRASTGGRDCLMFVQKFPTRKKPKKPKKNIDVNV